MAIPFITCTGSACIFDKTPDWFTLIFEIVVIAIALILLIWFSEKDSKVFYKYFFILLGVLLFDFFTHPMWNSYRLGSWAYIYRDVSWILSINLANLILISTKIAESIFKNKTDAIKFIYSVLFMIPFVWLSEWLLITMGVRSYSPEIQVIMPNLFLFKVPIGALYYIPAYTALLIGFAKYWELYLENKPLVPVRKPDWKVSLPISLIVVFLFEIMVEPMVQNVGLPKWSYIYRDISFLLSGLWVLVIWLSINIIDRKLFYFDLVRKFIAYMILAGLIMLPVESFLIRAGIRVYGPSATANFSGFMIPYFNVPSEIAFAIPFYLALVIATIKYWHILYENRKVAK